eukprot:scaffold176664_cov18-Tisochrysis_lutea.AAC.1
MGGLSCEYVGTSPAATTPLLVAVAVLTLASLRHPPASRHGSTVKRAAPAQVRWGLSVRFILEIVVFLNVLEGAPSTGGWGPSRWYREIWGGKI